jgi:predicted O-methyltransferase YrrM
MNPLLSLYHGYRWRAFQSAFVLPEVSADEIVAGSELVPPPYTERLIMPPRIGNTEFDDAGVLLGLVRALRPRTVLELGTAYGATTANICAVSDAAVYTVNALPEQISGRITSFTLTRDQIGAVYRKHGFTDRVTQIYANTWDLDLSRHMPPRSIDFAIIDACHDTNFVINDFLRVQPMLTEQATVLLHDVHPSMDKFLRDSYVACMYLRKLRYNVRHIENTWWGVWQAERGYWQAPALVRATSAADSVLRRLRRRDVRHDAQSMRWLSQQFRERPKA